MDKRTITVNISINKFIKFNLLSCYKEKTEVTDFNYDVHGIIRMKSNIDLSLVDRRLSYFRVEETEPDVTVYITKDFKVNIDKAIRLTPNLFGIENGKWIYYKKSLAHFKLKLLIKKLLDKTEIVATRSYLRMHLRIGRITPLWEIIPFIMDIKLLSEGYTFIHGACLSKEGKGFLLCAFPDTGKTLTTLLSLKKEHNFSYLSDDITIIDNKGYAYCYPDPHPIFVTERKTIEERDSMKALLKLLSPVIGFPVHEPTRQYADLYSEIKNPKVTEKTKIENIFFLERAKENIEEINPQKAYNKLLVSKRHEFPFCTDPIILGYSYFNPDFNLEKILLKEKRMLSTLTKRAHKTYILRSKNPKKFIELIESIL